MAQIKQAFVCEQIEEAPALEIPIRATGIGKRPAMGLSTSAQGAGRPHFHWGVNHRAMRRAAWLALCLFLTVALQIGAQQEPNESAATSTTQQAKPAESTLPPPAQAEKAKEEAEEKPVVTHHEIHFQGKLLKYTATAGTLPIKSAQGETRAHMFFVAYTLDQPSSQRRRPLTFAFNGGPGSASVWLHLGAIGPRRVRLEPNGSMPRPPFELEDNNYTWLDQTDLVFVDPVDTGYSRPTKSEYAQSFLSVRGDIESVGEFIRLYLTRYERWTSPLFLAGESYGTTRAAGLSNYLLEHGMALNGIVLISTVLNFETLEFTPGNDLPYALYLPSYTATAWFHKKLPSDLEGRELEQILPEVEQWARSDYLAALEKGDRLAPAERQSVVEHLERYTGLLRAYIEHSNLRINAFNFEAELLRGQNRMLGRLDSRFEGTDASGVSAMPDYDPLITEERPPFTSVFNDYVRSELSYKSDLPYYILGAEGVFDKWNWGPGGQGFPNVEPDLRSAFVKNPYMKLYVASGYYDLGTPFIATEYTLDHMGLDAKLRANITTAQFRTGHMIYIDAAALAKLRQDIARFIANALP